MVRVAVITHPRLPPDFIEKSQRYATGSTSPCRKVPSRSMAADMRRTSLRSIVSVVRSCRSIHPVSQIHHL